MNDNIKAGSDIHAGDGGYSISTQEKYDEFVKGRNQSLGKMQIQELRKHMTILYRIKPTDKKSIEAFYDVYSKDEQGNIRSWSVTELYRWGQGFVEDVIDLPYSDDKEHSVDPQIGWGCELEDLCAVDFEFDDSFTEEEKEQIENYWNDGDPNDEYERSGVAWLYDGDHNWQVDYDSVTIYGPFTVDKIDENVYNESIEVIELKPRPPFEATTAWPFSG